MRLQETIMFPKYSKYRLTEYLGTEEVQCHCEHKDCKTQVISAQTVESFRQLRNAYSKPIIVTSGFRCQRHNYMEGGTNDSRHKLGGALDLFVETREDLRQLKKMATLYFDIVIGYPTFIHCHNEGQECNEFGEN